MVRGVGSVAGGDAALGSRGPSPAPAPGLVVDRVSRRAIHTQSVMLRASMSLSRGGGSGISGSGLTPAPGSLGTVGKAPSLSDMMFGTDSLTQETQADSSTPAGVVLPVRIMGITTAVLGFFVLLSILSALYGRCTLNYWLIFGVFYAALAAMMAAIAVHLIHTQQADPEGMLLGDVNLDEHKGSRAVISFAIGMCVCVSVCECYMPMDVIECYMLTDVIECCMLTDACL